MVIGGSCSDNIQIYGSTQNLAILMVRMVAADFRPAGCPKQADGMMLRKGIRKKPDQFLKACLVVREMTGIVWIK